MLSVELNHLANILNSAGIQEDVADMAGELSDRIKSAVWQHAVRVSLTSNLVIHSV